MNGEDSTMAREAIFEAIENQLRDNDPPITKVTFERLKAEGYSQQETMKLIGCAFSSEISDMMNSRESYDEKRYSKYLKTLPVLPWEI